MEEQLKEAQEKMKRAAEARAAKAAAGGGGDKPPAKDVSKMTLAEQLQH